MTNKEIFLYALGVATAVVTQVDPRQMALPTPDAEWTVRDLLRHTVYELAWTPDVVQGKTVEEVGDAYDGDLLGGNVIISWRNHAERAKTAVVDADEKATAHLSYADKPVGEYLLEAANDQLVHAWDLGQATGVAVTFDESVARILYEWMQARQGELAASGLFAPPVAVPEDADTQEKLLGLLGRSSSWAEAAPEES